MDTIRAMSRHLKIISTVGAVLTFGIVLIVCPFFVPVHTCQASESSIQGPSARFEVHVRYLYGTIGLQKVGLDLNVFRYALIGYYNLKRRDAIRKRGIISIIDYRKSSNEKRFYVIDLIKKKVLYHTLVAHGRHSGEIYATHFSNEPGSLKSSLGFFVTGNTYDGDHGYSLYLYGKEKSFNDKARERRIIVHGAYYVRKSFIEENGRIGRSQGCPALPAGPHIDIIDSIVGGTCLFQFYDDKNYLAKSALLDPVSATAQFEAEYAPFVQIKATNR
jgi:hypothetical protein